MNEPERTVLVTLLCAGSKRHVLAKIVREINTDFIEARHMHGGYIPDGVNARSQRGIVTKGSAGRYELLEGDPALRAATRFRCSCGKTALIADVTFREAIAAGTTTMLSDEVPEAMLILSGQNRSQEVGRFLLSDTPRASP